MQATLYTGIPQVLDKRDKRRVYRLSDTNPNNSLLELIRKSGLGVSFEIIERALRASSRYVQWARYKC